MKIEKLKVTAVVEFGVQLLTFRRHWLPPHTQQQSTLSFILIALSGSAVRISSVLKINTFKNAAPSM